MAVTPQITYRSMPSSAALNRFIGEQCAALEDEFPLLQSCHVTIEVPHHLDQPRHFVAHVVVALNGRSFSMSTDPLRSEPVVDAYRAVVASFDVVRRQATHVFSKRRNSNARRRSGLRSA
jgi:hypothetical protein